MLYQGNNPILKIIGVEHMYWKGGTFDVKARDYSALAFRISGNANMKKLRLILPSYNFLIIITF